MTKRINTNYQIETPLDMITSIIPKGYNISEISSNISDIKKHPDGMIVTVLGYIDSFDEKTINDKLVNITAKLYKDGQNVYLKWITSKAGLNKMKFALKKSAPKETLLQVSGKIKSYSSGGNRYISITSPKIEKIGGESRARTNGIIIPEPQYVLKKDTTYFELKTAFKKIIKQLSDNKMNIDEFLPKELEEQFKLQGLVKSLNYMHGMIPLPIHKLNDFIAYNGFRRRVDAERIWKILKSTSKKTTVNSNQQTINYSVKEIGVIKDTLSKLPFELTIDQKKSINEFLKLLSCESGTRSLIYGDVGSGKTLVALISMNVILSNGGQSVIITPTTILAKQHYEEAKELFGTENVEFISTKTKIGEKRRISKRIEAGEPIIVIGGTSINNLKFKNLKAIFIDEEQKVGVVAKEKLFIENPDSNLIFMTATPIPRTLAAAIFTDFNIFQIKAKPKNRKKRITKIFKFDDAEIKRVKTRMIEDKQQTLVIVPSIDCEEMVNSVEVEKKYKKLFPESEVRAINGKMNRDEVEKRIEAYMNNEFPILIATVMVDSGFSNSNIAHVFIEGADRFGISQLHQIRGRCGRGELQGYCYLIPSLEKVSDSTMDRLNSIVKSEDGFELSQRDIELRGSGDLDGVKQSGTDLNFIEWIDEIKVMKEYIER